MADKFSSMLHDVANKKNISRIRQLRRRQLRPHYSHVPQSDFYTFFATTILYFIILFVNHSLEPTYVLRFVYRPCYHRCRFKGPSPHAVLDTVIDSEYRVFNSIITISVTHCRSITCYNGIGL